LKVAIYLTEYEFCATVQYQCHEELVNYFVLNTQLITHYLFLRFSIYWMLK